MAIRTKPAKGKKHKVSHKGRVVKSLSFSDKQTLITKGEDERALTREPVSKQCSKFLAKLKKDNLKGVKSYGPGLWVQANDSIEDFADYKKRCKDLGKTPNSDLIGKADLSNMQGFTGHSMGTSSSAGSVQRFKHLKRNGNIIASKLETDHKQMGYADGVNGIPCMLENRLNDRSAKRSMKGEVTRQGMTDTLYNQGWRKGRIEHEKLKVQIEFFKLYGKDFYTDVYCVKMGKEIKNNGHFAALESFKANYGAIIAKLS